MSRPRFSIRPLSTSSPVYSAPRPSPFSRRASLLRLLAWILPPFFIGYLLGRTSSPPTLASSSSSSISAASVHVPHLVPPHHLVPPKVGYNWYGNDLPIHIPIPKLAEPQTLRQGGGIEDEVAAGNWSVEASRLIPPFVHYTFFMADTPGRERGFGFVHYLCFISGITHIKPEKVFFWTLHPPERGDNWWWDRVLEHRWIGENGKEGKVFVKRVTDVNEIFGQPVEHWAHKADIIRLEALMHYGGIYLDLDVFVLKPFSSLYHLPVVMGLEAQPDPNTIEPSGLCNAIILAQPWAPFISRWYQSYRTFDKNLWAAHSVSKPYELALKNPYEIAVLDKTAFFWPLWHDEHLDLVHKTLDYSFTASKQFAYHLWESTSWSPHLEVLDPDRIHVWGIESGESSFTKKARDVIGNEIREKWREAKKRGVV